MADQNTQRAATLAEMKEHFSELGFTKRVHQSESGSCAYSNEKGLFVHLYPDEREFEINVPDEMITATTGTMTWPNPHIPEIVKKLEKHNPDNLDSDTLRAERNRMAHQRNALGRAIADAAIESGLCREDADITGPQLLMLAEFMGKRLVKTKNELELASERLIERPESTGATAPVPDFSAVEGKRVGDLSPTQMDDATELWLRKNSGWFQEREYLEFLLHRLDQARGVTPANQPSELAGNLRPGSTNTTPMNASAPMVAPELDDLDTAYRGLRKAIIDTSIEMAIVPPDYHQFSAEHNDIENLLKEMATQTGTTLRPVEHNEFHWQGHDLDNPIVLGQTRRYDELAARVTDLAAQLGHKPTHARHPLQHDDAREMLETISSAPPSQSPNDNPLDMLDDDESEGPVPY